MARQLEQYWDSAPDWCLTAEAYLIEVDFDQTCQEQAEYQEEMRLLDLNILYYDEIDAGFNEMFSRYSEDCLFLMELSAQEEQAEEQEEKQREQRIDEQMEDEISIKEH